jgi:hypothetical protein
MTHVNYDPVKARKERLLRRATELQDKAARLAEDLKPEEGQGHSLNAAIALNVVIHRLIEGLS